MKKKNPKYMGIDDKKGILKGRITGIDPLEYLRISYHQSNHIFVGEAIENKKTKAGRKYEKIKSIGFYKMHAYKLGYDSEDDYRFIFGADYKLSTLHPLYNSDLAFREIYNFTASQFCDCNSVESFCDCQTVENALQIPKSILLLYFKIDYKVILKQCITIRWFKTKKWNSKGKISSLYWIKEDTAGDLIAECKREAQIL